MEAVIEAAMLDLRRGLASRQRATVNDAARRLVEFGAPLGRQWQSVATALQFNGEWNLALAAIDRMVEQLPGAASRYARANILYLAGRFDAALAELDSLEADELGADAPADRVSLLNSRASMHLQLGQADRAREALLEALELDPASGQAWLSLAEIAAFRGADKELVSRLERAFREGPSSPGEAFKLAHAAGRMRHALKDYSGAFAAFSRGAELFRSTLGPPEAKPKTDLPALSSSFDIELIEEVGSRIHVPHDRVLFVSGLPRSGTTLVEQILASHHDVQHGQELGLFRHLAQEVGGLDAGSFRSWLKRGGDPNALVELYLHLASERLGREGRFVDKTIEAGNYMGLLLALFPRAPVFWLHRHPLDNGWSAFRTTFARGASWSWDLDSIGRRLAQEQAMIDYWSREASNRILFVEYEALVRDPEPHIRAIAVHAGLDVMPQMFRPNETRRSVATASASQVREPINLKGIGAAAPYREWLRPMVDSYERNSVKAGSA